MERGATHESGVAAALCHRSPKSSLDFKHVLGKILPRIAGTPAQAFQIMSITSFSFPTKTLFGVGAIQELPKWLEQAGIKSPDAPKSVRKIMKYHGVNVLKTSNEENFILHKGRWEKVSPERPT